MLDLGEYHHCLNVQDLEQSIAFYQKLGFQTVEDHRDERWAVLQHNNMVLALYQEHIECNLINFRGGDIETIVQELTDQALDFTMPATEQPDGSWSAELADPDGNRIFFNTFPSERAQYLQTGKLVTKPQTVVVSVKQWDAIVKRMEEMQDAIITLQAELAIATGESQVETIDDPNAFMQEMMAGHEPLSA